MTATLSTWLIDPLPTAEARAIERMRRLDDVEHVAVMPDVHLSGDVCVGTATATRRLVYPALIGGDIGCGMSAVAFDVEAGALAGEMAGRFLRKLAERIPVRRRNRRFVEPWPADLDVGDLSCAALRSAVRDEARLQLGTLGGGNHFLEFQADADGRLWLMLHTGSRQVGQEVRHVHTRGLPMPPLDCSTEAGQAYLHDVTWACRYASANRRAIARVANAIMHDLLNASADETTWTDCDHNHVAVEAEPEVGTSRLIHRKGAMRAGAGVPGILPGSMGTRSFHVVGRGEPRSLHSSAHGAGRRMSRSAARERFGPADVGRQLDRVWFDLRHTRALREELPAAYKDVRAVLRAQHALVSVERELRPVLVFKGA